MKGVNGITFKCATGVLAALARSGPLMWVGIAAAVALNAFAALLGGFPHGP